MNLSAPFIARPVATTLLTFGIAMAGMPGVSQAAGFAASAGRFSDDFGAGAASRREPGYRRIKLGKPARTAPRPNLPCHGNDLGQQPRANPHRSPVRH